MTPINLSAEPINEDGKKAVRINEVPDDGMMILKDADFSSVTIEFDVKGKNVKNDATSRDRRLNTADEQSQNLI